MKTGGLDKSLTLDRYCLRGETPQKLWTNVDQTFGVDRSWGRNKYWIKP